MARRRRPLASSVTVSALAALVWLACAASDARGRAPAGEPAPLRYAVTIPEPNQHYAAVTILVDAPRGQQSEWAMPAWTPGSYVIRDHGRQVDDLQAETLAGAPLPVEHRDKQTWRVGHGGQPHRLRYRVYADELTVRTSHVDDRHASLIGASVFLYPVGEGERPAEVELRPPAGWRVFAALPGGEGGALRMASPASARPPTTRSSTRRSSSAPRRPAASRSAARRSTSSSPRRPATTPTSIASPARCGRSSRPPAR
ncbi:MAG: hypothetical protein H6711_13645 [Myxococcales bacterium]|nr:hypothetical protein [Myxococcales bacterium]